MGIAPDWEEWDNVHLILDERASAFTRYVKNFVMKGFGLAAGAGLQVVIGEPGLNVAYVNGYEIKQSNALVQGLVALATNHVFLRFTKTPDPLAGTSAITISYVINTTGLVPPDSIKLGEVDTGVVAVTTVRNLSNKFKLHDWQMETDGDANQKQLKRLVISKGTAFPTVPAPEAGELFVRTDQLGNPLYRFDGVTWVLPGGASVFVEDELTPGFLGQTVFALSQPAVAGLSILFINAAGYAEGTHYTIAGAVLTWLDVPFTLDPLDTLVVKYQI